MRQQPIGCLSCSRGPTSLARSRSALVAHVRNLKGGEELFEFIEIDGARVIRVEHAENRLDLQFAQRLVRQGR